MIERPRGQSVPRFARGHEDVYQRFINGKIIFDNENGQRREFDIKQFATTLEGEFDLSGLTYTYTYNFNKVSEIATHHASDNYHVKVGFRKDFERHYENSYYNTIWITPKFLLDKVSSHPWKNVDWQSPIGIFWHSERYSYNMNSFLYLTSKQFDEISGQNLNMLFNCASKLDSCGEWAAMFGPGPNAMNRSISIKF